jgi:hypothetical protein
MKKYHDWDGPLAIVLGAMCITLFVLACFGWVLNLVAIAHWNETIGMEIVRICGVFLAPLGAILGWIR